MHASEVAGALAAIAIAVGVGAWLEQRRRDLYVARVARGLELGWTVELDDEGTRWLVREGRTGDGPFRVARERWARIDH
ncbi:hypothetical protein [Sandaracinus amylolyticus]|uniref:hypothetical protein n=1 Tax=Sandaracinus amylolyticus TaxID=927083 RepID=UPI001F183947|nr:hypothetical protein [Sandaracinus amylolyticus]